MYKGYVILGFIGLLWFEQERNELLFTKIYNAIQKRRVNNQISYRKIYPSLTPEMIYKSLLKI